MTKSEHKEMFELLETEISLQKEVLKKLENITIHKNNIIFLLCFIIVFLIIVMLVIILKPETSPDLNKTLDLQSLKNTNQNNIEIQNGETPNN